MTENHFKVVIPMYNVEKWVETTIKSVMLQSYSNFRCILVDDMSTDDTVDVVSSLIESDDRFTLVVNKKKKRYNEANNSSVIRKTLLHWGYLLTSNDLTNYKRS